MKVVFVRGHYDLVGDAASRAVAQLIGALTARGVDVRLLSYTEMRLGETHLHPAARRALFMLRATWTVARLRHRSVVVTLEEPTGVGLVARVGNVLRRLMGKPRHGHVSWLMDLFTLQRVNLSRQGKTTSRRLDSLRLHLDRAALRRADRIVVLGDCMRSVADAVFGPGRTSVVPIWQPGEELSGGDGAWLRTAWGIPADGTVVLYSGHLNYRHPVDAIPDVAARTAGDGVEFVFVGSGARMEELAESADWRSPPNLHFREKPSGASIRDVLAAGDVHLVALEDEATGTCVPSKTYAAMAAARPIVYLGSIEGQAARDTVAARAGFVSAPDDVESLTTELRRLHRDQALRQELGKRGHDYFVAERDLPVIVERWLALLTEVDDKASGQDPGTPALRGRTRRQRA